MLRCFNTSISSTETFIPFGANVNDHNVPSDKEIIIDTMEFFSTVANTITIKKYNSGSSSVNFQRTVSVGANSTTILDYKQFAEPGQRISITSTASGYASVSYDKSSILDI